MYPVFFNDFRSLTSQTPLSIDEEGRLDDMKVFCPEIRTLYKVFISHRKDSPQRWL